MKDRYCLKFYCHNLLVFNDIYKKEGASQTYGIETLLT